MSRRLLLSALLAASLLVAFEAGRASASRSATSSIPAPAPHGEPDPSLPFPTPHPAIPRGPSVPGQIRGTASWGWGWAGIVTRLPRGTRICVTGPIGRWCGRSVGYGPARWTHRIADLSRSVFAAICGNPSMGLCRVAVTW